MKYLIYFLTAFFILQNSILLTASAQETEPAITIINIVSNKVITGKVSGLKPGQHEDLKVIVYVHTDKWYIHPYVGGGPGKSYAKIEKNGSWQIKTEKREFPADQVAALVVDMDYKPASPVSDIWGIPVIARIIQDEDQERL